VRRGIALLFLALLMGVGGVIPMPRPPLHLGKTRYPLYRRLGGPQGRYGLAENLVPTGIQSSSVQLIAQSLHRLSYPAHHGANSIPIKEEKQGGEDHTTTLNFT